MGKIRAKFGKSDKIWANLIGFGQNQNLASPKNIRSPTAMLITLWYYKNFSRFIAIDLNTAFSKTL